MPWKCSLARARSGEPVGVSGTYAELAAISMCENLIGLCDVSPCLSMPDATIIKAAGI